MSEVNHQPKKSHTRWQPSQNKWNYFEVMTIILVMGWSQCAQLARYYRPLVGAVVPVVHCDHWQQLLLTKSQYFFVQIFNGCHGHQSCTNTPRDTEEHLKFRFLKQRQNSGLMPKVSLQVDPRRDQLKVNEGNIIAFSWL